MSVVTLHEPTHREALWELEAAFERGDMVTVFGRCAVEYDGRAASSLGLGDRLLVLKPDGTALVHTDEKRKPVNWQPPGCEHRAAVRDGRLRVRSERTSPSERLDVRFEAVHQLSALSVTGGRSVDLTGSEEDLRRYVVERPEAVEDGFVPLSTERETAAGPVDIFGEDADGRPLVVELKRRRVGPSAAGQLQRYVDALREEFGDDAGVRGVLVAPSVTDRAAELLERDDLEFVALDPATGRPPDEGTDLGAGGAAARPSGDARTEDAGDPDECDSPDESDGPDERNGPDEPDRPDASGASDAE